MKKIYLKNGRDFSVRKRHPWIFSGAIARGADAVQDGELVRVLAENKDFLGLGHFSKAGSIAVKMLSTEDEEINSSFWTGRIRSAAEYRKRLGFPNQTTNAFRLVHGEGDKLPGLIIDYYAGVCVLQAQSRGMYLAREELAQSLQVIFGSELRAVVDRSVSGASASEDGDDSKRGNFLYGDIGKTEILESKIVYAVDCVLGQKTGFFLDQRDNRKIIGELSSNKTVLNAFCYSGGFSMAALAGGAKSVTSLDSSDKALALLEENLRLNASSGNFPGDVQHTTIEEDFLRYMQNIESPFEVIVLDPPAFAKHRKSLDSGLRGYRSINTAALRAVTPGGFLATFSCSQLVSRDDFKGVIAEAALKAEREVRIVREFHQAPCHPVDLFHPEGEYLKGFLLQVR